MLVCTVHETGLDFRRSCCRGPYVAHSLLGLRHLSPHTEMAFMPRITCRINLINFIGSAFGFHVYLSIGVILKTCLDFSSVLGCPSSSKRVPIHHSQGSDLHAAMKLTLLALIAFLSVSNATITKHKRTFAVLRFTNKQLTIGRADPIVNPGGPSPHLHHVLGGSAFSVNATGNDLQGSKCSTAKVKGDNSAYWFPSLFFRDPKSGKYESVEIYYAQVYYFFEPTNDQTKAFPLGLNMVVGDAMTRSPPRGGATGNLDPSKGPVNPVQWTCPRKSYVPPSWQATSDGTKAGIPNIHNKAEGAGFPDANCDEFASPLRADVHFPSCYNPDAGLTNFRTNMAYPTNTGDGRLDCPKGWIHVPHLFFEVYWNTPLFGNRWEPGKGKQPFVLANGDATGYSLHGDFLSGWDESLLQHVIDTCDAGTLGMDKCSGLYYGVNNDDACTIPSPVSEVISGVMDALPGNNPISGWFYGPA